MKTLVLKGATPNNNVIVAYSKQVEDFLVRNGVKPEIDSEDCVICHVSDPYSVYKQLLDHEITT